MELETDKAVVEVPSSVSGVVKDIRVKEGEKVTVGQVYFHGRKWHRQCGAGALAREGSATGHGSGACSAATTASRADSATPRQ